MREVNQNNSYLCSQILHDISFVLLNESCLLNKKQNYQCVIIIIYVDAIQNCLFGLEVFPGRLESFKLR